MRCQMGGVGVSREFRVFRPSAVEGVLPGVGVGGGKSEMDGGGGGVGGRQVGECGPETEEDLTSAEDEIRALKRQRTEFQADLATHRL